MTQQFRHCGNAFRADTYRGCNFGCTYCFANYRNYCQKADLIQKADLRVFEKYINNNSVGLNQELINNKVPIHLGGMSDPFQEAEKEYGITYKFLKLFKNYPVQISTKTAYLDDKYFELLNPAYHTFQISLFTDNEERLSLFEKNTPTAKKRIGFIKELKKRGFWVGLRIQPLINIDEAISLINKLDGFIDYCTVEHLKITATGNKKDRDSMFDKLGNEKAFYKYRRTYFKLPTEIITSNIKQIKANTNVKIGCGDNEIHQLSDSLNCCGLDTMPNSFKNWMKYNSMQIMMTGNKEVFTPISKIYNSNVPEGTYARFNRNRDYKFYVDKYLEEVYKYGEVNLFT